MDKTVNSATQRAYDHIRDRLQNHELRPGTRLVTRNLAKELGTSLNPVREALNRLSSQGLVEHVPGSGTYVHRLDEKRVQDLYGARIAIECFAVGEAAKYATEAELEDLRRICTVWQSLADQMRAAGQKELPAEHRETWGRNEEVFHQTLVAACRNQILSEMVEEKRILTLMFESLQPQVVPVTVEMVEQVARTHGDLVDVVARHDSAAASEQMERMLLAGRETFLRNLQG